jgi:hypothetical protein
MIRSNKGQTFFEFVFLLAIIFAISFSFMKGINKTVKMKWKDVITVVVGHDQVNQPPVEFP